MDEELEDGSLISGRNKGKSLFSQPDRLWGPPSFIYIAYGGLFPRGKKTKH
jgi:hypothetical protein